MPLVVVGTCTAQLKAVGHRRWAAVDAPHHGALADILTRREQSFERQLDLDPDRLVFIDET